MALLCDYFTAASAAEAEETLDWTGGPSAPPSPKGLLRRRPAVAPHPTVSLPGMEPTMWMSRLDEVLTGRTFQEFLRDPTGKVTATRDGGERVIVPITSRLQDALAGLDDARMGEVAQQWAAPDDHRGTATDPEVAQDALRELVNLVRAGRERGESLYCWVCV